MEILPLAPDALAGAGCSLEAPDLRERVAAWRALRDRATRVTPREDGALLRFDRDMAVTEIERLVALESACCPFYEFSVESDRMGTSLLVEAGPGNGAAVQALLGLS